MTRGVESLCDSELEKLERLVVRIAAPSVRRQIQAVHDVLDWLNEVCQLGGPDVGSPQQSVGQACSEGVDVLGAYIRGESIPSEPMPRMRALMDAQEATLAEKDRMRRSGELDS